MPWYPAKFTVCVDFDGVLNNYVGYIEGYTYPFTDAGIQFLRDLKMMGFNIVILTSARLADVERGLHARGVDELVDNITNVKVPAIAYIDDRAICFHGNFAETLEELKHFKAWWENDNTKETPDFHIGE